MAERKQFITVGPPDEELVALLAESRSEPVTETELHEQRISFAFGDAPADSALIPQDSVRRSAQHISLRAR